MCGNRINLVYDSKFHASSQSSCIQFYFYMPKKKKNKNSYIYLPYQNAKYNFPDFPDINFLDFNLLMTHFLSIIYFRVYIY